MKKLNRLSTVAALVLMASPLSAGLSDSSTSTTMMTASCPSAEAESSMMSKLDKEHQDMYKSMDCEGKKVAQDLMEQTCKGKNSCKGLNSCKTDEHSCAGMGSCQGTSKGPFTDKNKAVEAAKKHMESKRSDAMGQ